MYKMERLNVVRYVETEKERDKLKAEGFKESPKITPKKRGAANGDTKVQS